MAYSTNRQYVKRDKFGNKYQSVACHSKKLNGYLVGYVTLGGRRYKLSTNGTEVDSKVEKYNGTMIINVTEVPSRSGYGFERM